MSFIGDAFQPNEIVTDARTPEARAAQQALFQLFGQQLGGGFQRNAPGGDVLGQLFGGGGGGAQQPVPSSWFPGMGAGQQASAPNALAMLGGAQGMLGGGNMGGLGGIQPLPRALPMPGGGGHGMIGGGGVGGSGPVSGSHMIRSMQPQYQNQALSPNISMQATLPGGTQDPFGGPQIGGGGGGGDVITPPHGGGVEPPMIAPPPGQGGGGGGSPGGIAPPIGGPNVNPQVPVDWSFLDADAGAMHDPFSSQMFGGSYVTPFMPGQLDSMTGMQNMLQQNPMVGNQQMQQALSAAASGSPVFHPNFGQSLTDVAQGWNFDNAFDQDLTNMVRGGEQFGGDFSDLGQFNELFGELAGGPATQDFASLARQAGGLDTGLGDTSQALLSQLAQFENPEAAQSAGLFDQLSAQLPGILNPAGFDQTDMFQNARQVFDRDLEDQLAKIRAESSAMGLDPGATDREGRLAREAGHALAQFNVGQQQLAQQSFENQQQRGLQGFGAAQGLGNIADVADRMGLQAQGIRAQAIPGVAQAESIPFQQQMQQLGMQGDLMGRQSAQDLAAFQARSQLLNPAMQAAQIPFQEQFAAHEAGAGRQAGMLPQALQQGNLPLQTMMQMQTDAANRQMQALNPMLQAQGMGFDQQMNALLSNFGMGEQMRQVGDSAIDRQMGEFARTQNAMLPFMMGMAGLTGPETHFGPSTVSQIGSLLGGIGSLFPG